MGLRIGTNLAAIGIARNLSKVSGDLSRNYMRLATGKAYATTGDAPGNVSRGARLRATIRSAEAAVAGVQDGISISQVADAALTEIEDALVRMRELGVSAQQGTLAANEKTAMQSEFSKLVTTIGSIANATTFNGHALLNGTGTIAILSSSSGGTTTLTINDNDSDALSGDLGALDISSGAAAAVTSIDAALTAVGTNRAAYGGYALQFESLHHQLQAEVEGLSGTLSNIEDVDVARETAEMTKNSILQQAGLSMLAQASAQPRAVLALLTGF